MNSCKELDNTHGGNDKGKIGSISNMGIALFTTHMLEESIGMHSILSRCLNSIQGYIKLAFSQHMKLISICFRCTTCW